MPGGSLPTAKRSHQQTLHRRRIIVHELPCTRPISLANSIHMKGLELPDLLDNIWRKKYAPIQNDKKFFHNR